MLKFEINSKEATHQIHLSAMKTAKLLALLLCGVLLMSASQQNLEFDKPIVLTFKKIEGWSKWHSPEAGKAWKIESIWTSCHANTPDYIVQINDVKTRHEYDEEFSSFWLSDNDSIRISKKSPGYSFAISILEYSTED